MARSDYIVARFGGVNTDEPANRLASGTARVARNVRLEGTSPGGRPGFAEYDVTGAALAGIMSAATFKEDAGDWYLIVKRLDGATAGLDYAKVYNAATSAAVAISAWVSITDQWSGHSISDKGWYFSWADRIYHFDRKGGSKWNVTTTNKPVALDGEAAAVRAWKAGVYSSIGPVLVPAVGGAMRGRYFAGAAKLNSVTHEISCIQHLQRESAEVYPEEGNAYGAVTIINSAADEAIQDTDADNAYEWNRIQMVRSMGGSENAFGADSWTQRLFFDTSFPRGTSDDSSMSISDATLGTRLRHTNSGGLPPPASHGDFNGLRAVYGGCFYNSALVPGQVAFSLQGFPCMVPGDSTYLAGGVSLTWAAEPYNGFLSAAVPGVCRAIRAVGGRFIVVTDSGSAWMVAAGDSGAMVALSTRVPGGCTSDEGAVGSPRGVYWIGPDILMLADGRGVRNVGLNRFGTTLAAIPSARRGLTVGAAYTSRHEVWFAVSRESPYNCNYVVACDYAGSPVWRLASATAAGGGYTYNYQLLPDVPATNDAFYLVWTAKPTSISAKLLINRPAKYAAANCLTAEYYNGAWTALTLTSDGTNPDYATGGCPGVDDGTIAGDSPSGWASTTLDSGGLHVTGYAIRFRVASGKAASITRSPILTSVGPSRILIYDEDREELVGWFDPRNLLGSYITWMCELARPCDSPAKMLLFLADGRILYYPSASYADSVAGDSWNYSTEWLGYFGQERRHREARDVTARVHLGANTRRLSVSVTGLKTGAEDIEAPAVELSGANDVFADGITFAPYRHGLLYKVRITTTASELAAASLKCNSPDWSVTDLILETATP